MREYDQISTWYASNRSSGIGIPELERLTGTLPDGAKVLDVGCGNGRPLAIWLLEKGFDVVGLDSSLEMLHQFRENCPTASAFHGRIEDMPLRGSEFDAVLAWGTLFHIVPADQEKCIHYIGTLLKPGGRFLFTSAKEDGTRTGEMNGVTFHYWSLGRARYVEVLAQAGFALVEEGYDAGKNYKYLAEKIETP